MRAPSSTGPRLVLMDEPTGLGDQQVRQGMWALIDQLRRRGQRS